MTQPLDYQRWTPARRITADLGLLLIRLPLGATFANAGWMKIHGGVAAFVDKTSGAIPASLPHALGKAYLYALPFAELTVGVCLVLGLFGRTIGFIASLMLISFMIAVTGVKGEQGALFHFNVFYFCVALGIALLGPGRISVDALLPRRAGKPKE